MALWDNSFHQPMETLAYQFNQSITSDIRLFEADITASIAHATMLGVQKILTEKESKQLVTCLEQMLQDYNDGRLTIDLTEEDIHSFIEAELTRRLGTTGKKIHTGRSRNDQVAIALKCYTRQALNHIDNLLIDIIHTLISHARENLTTILPGYTHLQRAQPITYGHYLMSYVEMFQRDRGRINDTIKRINATMPLGAGALATTSFAIDRQLSTDLLGFTHFSANSIDAVSDRDYTIEALASFSLIAMHLSRYAEETILWASQEYQFVSLADAISSGSSIMPQKKNPDMHELIRGKTGRVYGDLMGVLSLMKGLPLAYNKDMQEEKTLLFDGIDTLTQALALLPLLVNHTYPNKERMLKAASQGFINATDCADYLVTKGLAFRDAYQITGQILQYCVDNQTTLDILPLKEYQLYSTLFDEDIYQAIDLMNCVNRRQVAGGPATEQVLAHIKKIENELSYP